MKRLLIMTAAIAMNVWATAQTTADGIKMYRFEKYQSAIKILTPLGVKDPMANYYLGLSYLDGGNVSKADYTFQRYPEDPANMAGEARVAFAKKDAAKGNQIAKDVAAKAKKKEFMPLVYAADALTYSEGTDLQQAIQWYKDALAKDPGNFDAHLGMGDVYRKQTGGGGPAMDNYEAITDKDQKNSVVLTRIGDLWYDARTYNNALDFYQKAKDADATNPLPYRSLALAYQRTGKFDLALQNIKKYIELSDNTVSDQVSYAEILYQAKNYCDAVKVAGDLLQQNPPADKKNELNGILGFSEAQCGDSTEALRYIREYFKHADPKTVTPAAYIEFGKLWLKLNEIDSASYYYTKGISVDTAQNKNDVYRQIAEAYKSRKDYCKSAEWYNNLVKSNPSTQPLDYFWSVVMYYYCKDLKQALVNAENFEAKYPDQPSSVYWHARVLAAIDSEATTGAAAPSFIKYLDQLGPEGEAKPDKKNDVRQAYEYLVLYNYNAKDKEALKKYMERLKAIDPNDTLLKQIEELEKSPGGGGKKPGKK